MLGSEIDDSRHGLYVEVIYVEVLCEVFYWVEMCWLDGCWLVTQTGFSKAHMANKGKCYSGDSFNGLLLCIAS